MKPPFKKGDTVICVSSEEDENTDNWLPKGYELEVEACQWYDDGNYFNISTPPKIAYNVPGAHDYSCSEYRISYMYRADRFILKKKKAIKAKKVRLPKKLEEINL